METEVYAKEVVKNVLEAEGWLWRTQTIWAGGGAGKVRWLSWILPEIVTDRLISRMFGFDKLRQGEGEKVIP